MKKIVSTLLILSIVFTGCSASEEIINNESASMTSIDKKEIEEVCSFLSKNATEKMDKGTLDSWDEVFTEFDESDSDAKKLTALCIITDVALGQMGAYDRSSLLYLTEKALSAYPEHPLILSNAASIMFEAGYVDEAIKLYEQSLIVSANNPIVLTNLANCYLNKGNYSKAKEYASRSVSLDNEYSPAYQVLTSVHLEDGNHCLAAETMIKSARNCFDDVTMYQMDSFLQEVELLEPTEEFPVREEIIDEFYTIMNQDGEAVLPDMDSPESQLELPEFPEISSMEGLMQMREQFGKATNEWIDLLKEALDKSVEYSSKKAQFVEKRSTSSTVMTSVPSLKQIYAFEILTAFYGHKLKVAQNDFVIKNDKVTADIEENYKKAEDILPDEVKEDEIWNRIEEMSLSGISPSAAWPVIREQFTYFDDYMKEIIEIDGKSSTQIIDLRRDYYNEVKQICEEYWLKSGGMLKYVGDEGTFEYLCAVRDFTIYNNMYVTIADLDMLGMSYQFKNELEKKYKETFFPPEPAEVAGVGAAYFNAKEMEMPPLPMYPEKSPSDWNFSLGFVSIESTTYEFKVTVSTPFSNHSYRKNTYDGRVTSTRAYGINPVVGLGIKKLMGEEKYRELRDKIWNKYDLLIPYNPEQGFVGKYQTLDSKNRVVDKGSYNLNEASIQLPAGFEANVSRETMKSFVTGITETNKSKSLSFSYDKLKTNLN